MVIITIVSVLAITMGPAIMDTMSETRITRIDEKLSTETSNHQNFGPYSMTLKNGASQGNTTVWWLSNQGTGTYLVRKTEAQIAVALNFTSATALYCKNGTAKIFWGKHISVTTLAGVLFKRGSNWYVNDQVPIGVVPSWLSSIMNEHFAPW